MKCWNGPTMTLLTVIVAWVTVIPMPQLWAQTRGHVLWGDFVIDMSRAPPGSPQTFQLVLTRIPGRVVDRQTVGSRDRYRFHGVSNGEYLLTIEVDHREILSMPLSIREFRPTDIPRHLSLQWSDLSGQSVDTSALMYARKAANQKRLDKAQGAMQKNDLKTAVILLQEVVDSDPQDYEAWTDLATCRFRQDKLSAAVEAYQNALSANPDYFIAQFNQGKVELARKNFSAAVESLARAVEMEVKSAEAHYFLGEAYLGDRKGSKALGHLETAIRLDPEKMADAHLRIAALYNAAGLKGRAAAQYREYLRKQPDSPNRRPLEEYIRQHGQP